MKSLTIASVIDKNRLASDQAWIIGLKIHVIDPETHDEVDIIRVVSNDEALTIQGEVYEPVPFTVDINEAVNEVATVSVSIQDQSQTVQAEMQAYRGGVGFTVEMLIVRATHTTVNYEPDLHEFFTVVSASANDYVVNWQLGAENPLNETFPRGTQMRDRCRWSYKGPECGYAGARASCSRTLRGTNGCEAHNNAPRFGGYPGIKVR